MPLLTRLNRVKRDRSYAHLKSYLRCLYTCIPPSHVLLISHSLFSPHRPEKEEGVEYRLGTILTLATDGARRFSDGVATIHLPVNRSTTVLRADNTTLNIATVQCVYWHTLKR